MTPTRHPASTILDAERHRFVKSACHAFFEGADYRPTSVDSLAARLQVPARERAGLESVLGELEEEGVAVEVAGRGWCSPHQEGWIVGTLQLARSGTFGFVRPAREDSKGDVFIPPRKTLDAYDGDLVLAKAAKPRRKIPHKGKKPPPDSREGKILLVIRRSHRVVPGRYFSEGRSSGVVEPAGGDHLRNLYVPAGKSRGAKDGARVLARLLDAPSHAGMPIGEVVELLAAEGSWRADLQLIAAEYQLDEQFPPAVLAEADALADGIPAAERARRADLRGKTIFTIDPVDAKDFDDAVTLERAENGNHLLGVFIADVSHYVRTGSELDREAYRRATSVYLPGRTFPMLPERISNGLCSLRPDEDRLVQGVWMEISAAGDLKGWRHEPAVMRSARRYAYEEVQELLDGKTPAPGEEALAAMLGAMDQLRGTLRARRLARGALELDLEEQQIVLDSAGDVVDVRARPRDRAHNLVEEFMLAANEAVARTATARDVEILRRHHPPPAEENLEHLLKFCRFMVPGIPVHGPEDFQRLVDTIRGRPVAPIINMILLRSLSRAEYAAHKSLHFALAKDEYCHFTSPIRRYPDLQVHRALFGPEAAAQRAYAAPHSQLAQMAEHCSLKERLAEEAEREMDKLRSIQWLSRRIGERFIGVVSAVFDFGFFVRLDGCMVEGMVPVASLAGDIYTLHEASFALRGRSKGKYFRIGDAVEVELLRADAVQRHVDLRYLMHRQSRV